MISVIRPGRALITTTRDDRKTASGIEWVTNRTVVPGLLPDPQDLGVHPLPGHLVERAERLVHQEDRWPNARARAIATRCCIPPDSWYGWCSGSRRARRGRASPSPGRTAGSRPSPGSRGAAHVVLDGPPVEEDGGLEDHPVVAVAARLLRGLVVDAWTVPLDGAVRSPTIRSRVDLPQPDGPISETNSPGRRRGRCPRGLSSRPRSPRLNVLSTPASWTTGPEGAAVNGDPARRSSVVGLLGRTSHGRRPRRTTHSIADDREVEDDPEHRRRRRSPPRASRDR